MATAHPAASPAVSPAARAFPPPHSTASGLRWARLDAREAIAPRDLKLILGAGEFRQLCGTQANDGYYRGRDARGNVITVRVVADEAA